ncbi:vacuolar lysine transporter YPQ1 [Nicotiana tabacum]|uniref:Lysosomal amino acid transporter 1 homolog n=2 Tax=Nicotiana TaxID=4085 RepID=A0A1S3Y1K7_TOBAC|nr:PREDICTED: lysosomal amino acid transporter 1 homolog isoform X1 [Nicotiana sylvestris]XP_016446108.1 PREDICTED: lysosomal amino acid transporter 1 homolog [Nicotiana tabacum]
MKALMSLRQQNSIAYCVKEKKPCIGWVNRYFKDCLCNLSDEFSFAFGLVSLSCWAVAEIPQIITNFRTKSSHGVSLLFLLGWVGGDIFNLAGCLLEPATLPTQLYTAVLYTTTTIILVLQSLYYDYFYRCWKQRDDDSGQEVEEVKKPLRPQKPTDSGIPIPKGIGVSASRRMDFYFTSARSLAGSATPPFRSNLRPIASGPSAVGLNHNYSSDEDTVDAPLNISVSQPKPIPRSAGYGAFLATSSGMPHQTKALIVGFGGRKLLQEHGTEHSALGQVLGWMMAAVYMGGRLPQIWLNIKRGNVEGLNPLMFVFALIANVTYVGSILLRSTEWSKIKANMPWLLDAVVCVVLDLFIILQYVYYKYFRKQSSTSNGRDYEGAYKEANKY